MPTTRMTFCGGLDWSVTGSYTARVSSLAMICQLSVLMTPGTVVSCPECALSQLALMGTCGRWLPIPNGPDGYSTCPLVLSTSTA